MCKIVYNDGSMGEEGPTELRHVALRARPTRKLSVEPGKDLFQMMKEQNFFQVAGVDGCKAGWLIAVVSGTKKKVVENSWEFTFEKVIIADTFAEVLSETIDCVLVCIDIPIGLSNGEKPRQCDAVARKILRGARASSVFPAPIRPCLPAQDYETACKISLEHSGKKLSKQSFALLRKIRQVDELMTPPLQQRVREIHPEVSFWALNGKKAIQQNKKTFPGQARRHRSLQDVFEDVDIVLAQAPDSGYVMDDALDAIVAAWTAGQTIIGKAATLPEKPEHDSKGLRMEILYSVK